MRVKNIALIIILAAGVLPGPVPKLEAAPLWKQAANTQLKITGAILIADEKGIHWDDRLPEGWSWLRSSEKPNRTYFGVGQIFPRDEVGKIIFRISRWNFINNAIQDGFSEEAAAAKIRELGTSPTIRFREDEDLAEARAAWDGLIRAQAEVLLTEPRREIDFSIGAKGGVVLTTTGGGLYKLYVENFSTSGMILAAPVSDSSAAAASGPRIYVRILEHGWRLDLDGDGLVDLVWTPISHIASSRFGVPRGFRIAVVEIYSR